MEGSKEEMQSIPVLKLATDSSFSTFGASPFLLMQSISILKLATSYDELYKNQLYGIGYPNFQFKGFTGVFMKNNMYDFEFEINNPGFLRLNEASGSPIFNSQGKVLGILVRVSINFLFSEKAITSEQLIALVDKYNYTPPERLNLFLLILHKNISEEELSKLFTVWNIAEYTAVYAHDYKKYMSAFIDTLSFSSEEQNKETVLSMFDKHQLPITSVLHELFQANKATLFNEAIKNPQVKVNIQNYLSQTVLHTASNAQWINAEPYIRSLFQRPDLNLNIVDFQGWTPIFYIVHNSQSRDSEGIKLFLSRRPKLNMGIQDYNLRALPLLAVELGMPDLAELLHQQGAPLPEQVSRLNSYMTNDYKAIWFKYKMKLDLDEMAQLFNVDSRKPSFSIFQGLQADEFLMEDETTWEHFKYYFLFQMLHNFFTKEEDMRYVYRPMYPFKIPSKFFPG